MYYVYIMSNNAGSVLYAGVTNDLARRVYEHKEKFVPGFTSRYNVSRLLYYEACDDVISAITREKQIKGGSRRRKLDLISAMNPEWRDLYNDL